jgi:hypothetical protein
LRVDGARDDEPALESSSVPSDWIRRACTSEPPFQETRAIGPPEVALGARPLVETWNSASGVPFARTKFAWMRAFGSSCVGCSCQATSQRSAKAVTEGSTEK